MLLLPSAAPVIGHAGKHNIGSVLLRVLVLYGADWSGRRLLGLRRQRSGRRRRQESISLGNSGEPVTLPSGVVGGLRAAMELAGRIQGFLVRESWQPIGLAALLPLGGRLPFWLLILDRRHLSAGQSRLGGLPLVISWLLPPTGVTSRSPRSLRCHLAGRIN